ncbi:MAG: dihydrofolate reductase family protein [Candidatus Hydrogenedentota bacterium]
MKTTAYLATSIDGFIARPDGSVDWLGDPDDDSTEDYDFVKFFETVDVLVMGSHTYEFVLDYGTWPYEDKPVVVLSSRSIPIPDEFPETIEMMNCPPNEVVERLAERGAKHLYIDGGLTVQQFLNAGLIDRFIITRIPILIGEGIPLFGPITRDIKLKHVNTTTFPDGLTQSEYEVRRESH